MKYKYYLYEGCLLLLLGFASLSFAAENFIDLNNTQGFGFAPDQFQIDNIYVETPHPNNPQARLQQHYNVVFQIDPVTLHLVPIFIEESCANLELIIKDRAEGYPLNATWVTVNHKTYQTNDDGFVRFEHLPPQPITVHVEHEGFISQDRDIALNCEQLNFVEIGLDPQPPSFPAKHVHIELNWGENPRDLDAHLTGPAPGLEASYKNAFERFHLYFGNESSEVAHLTIDQFSNAKPEIIDIYPRANEDKLLAGRYCLIVHHFNGAGSLTESDAQVSVWVDKEQETQHYTYTPPAIMDGDINRENNDVWYAIDLHVDEQGEVNIIPIQAYAKQVNPNVVRCR